MIKKLTRMVHKYISILSYLFFGACTTAVNILVFYLCIKLKLSTSVSSVIAWFLSVLFAFFTNRQFVFKEHSNFVWAEIVRFFASRATTGLLDIVIMVLFVDYLSFDSMLIKVLSNVIVIVLNYIISRFFVFK